MDLYPNLFRLAWRKNKTVKEELENLNWTRGLWRMGSVDEMAQFIELWDYTLNIHLTDQADQIKWNWTANVEYSSKSAYLAQFHGSYSTFKTEHIWKAETEGNISFLHGC